VRVVANALLKKHMRLTADEVAATGLFVLYASQNIEDVITIRIKEMISRLCQRQGDAHLKRLKLVFH